MEEALGFALIIISMEMKGAKPIYEEALVKVLLGILKSEEINEEIFKENIEKIKIEENRIVTVILKNGKSVEKGMM